MCEAMEEWKRQLLEEGVHEGLATGRAESVKQLMQKLHMSMQEAFDLLDIAEGERVHYEQLLTTQE